MSAQYHPYRNEDGTETMETSSWTDHELGSVQIFQGTTEELPNRNGKRKIMKMGLIVTVSLLIGYFIGYAVLHRKFYNQNSDDLFKSTVITIRDEILLDVNKNFIEETIKRFNNVDRRPGTEGERNVADFFFNQFRAYGLENVTKSYYDADVSMPAFPTNLTLVTRDNRTIHSNLIEEKYEYVDQRPFLTISQSGPEYITNELIFVNKGTEEDYDKLGFSNNDTYNKVFVIRYSSNDMIESIMIAQKRYARAILIFPDPDIFGESSPFPPSMHLPIDAGLSIPLTWNSNSYPSDTTHLEYSKFLSLEIPVIPISFKFARKILRGLAGQQVPSELNCFDFTLYTGPGYKDENEDGRSKLIIAFHNRKRLVRTGMVSGILLGSVEPDRYIVIGSRRDSFNRGCIDSLSGSAVMLEIIRVFGNLKRSGWRPKRTIIFNNFGAESLHHITSTQWLKQHSSIMRNRVVAFLNCDTVVLGDQTLTAAASPLLFQVLFNSSRLVENPNINIESNLTTVYDSWTNQTSTTTRTEMVERFKEQVKLYSTYLEGIKVSSDHSDKISPDKTVLSDYWESATSIHRPHVNSPNSYSMYTRYLHYAGIPVLDLKYTGYINHKKSKLFEQMMPLLGSKYDNYGAISRIDEHFKYHKAIGELYCEVLFSLSDALVLPFNLLEYAVSIKGSFDKFAAWTRRTFNNTSPIDLRPFELAIEMFSSAAIKFHHNQNLLDTRDLFQVRIMNDKLMLLERLWVETNDLSGQWNGRHLLLDYNEEGFPSLFEYMSGLDVNSDSKQIDLYVTIIKVHQRTLISAIYKAARLIDGIHSYTITTEI